MNIVKQVLFCIVALSFTTLALAQSYETLSPEASAKLIKKNEGQKSFVILDVRTSSEYSEGHIKKAINIDFNDSHFAQNLSNLDKNHHYLVYCRSGRRSTAAADLMVKSGFKKISNMLGGIVQWTAESRPLEK